MSDKLRTEFDTRDGYRIVVELNEGVLKDEIRAWVDDPARPRPLAQRTCWHRSGRGPQLYHEITDTLLALDLSGRPIVPAAEEPT